MAYNNPLPTVTNLGDGDWEVSISETGCANGDEAQAIQMPKHLGNTKFRLLRTRCRKTAGSAVTVQPTLGRQTDPVANNAVERQAIAASAVDEQYIDPIFVRTDADGRFFHRSLPSAGADNAILTDYRLKEGWNPVD